MKISGALEKKTRVFVNPNNATKDVEYICISCNKNVIACALESSKVCPYFRHKSQKNNPCTHFTDSPSVSEIHREGEHIMKKLLDDENKIVFSRKYRCCGKTEKHLIKYPENCRAVLEHSFKFDNNTKRGQADVALLDKNNNIKYIFEIKHTHRTRCETRPGDWFEIDASWLREYYYADLNRPVFEIECCRDEQCNDCKARNLKKRYRYLWQLRIEKTRESNRLLKEEITKRIIKKQRAKQKTIYRWRMQLSKTRNDIYNNMLLKEEITKRIIKKQRANQNAALIKKIKSRRRLGEYFNMQMFKTRKERYLRMEQAKLAVIKRKRDNNGTSKKCLKFPRCQREFCRGKCKY